MATQTLQRLLVDVVVPAHNCAGSLPGVISRLPVRQLRSVVVVDNGSTDQTAQVARDHGTVVVRERRPGYGAACRRGIAHLQSLPQPPDIVVFVRGDGNDDPSEIPALLEPFGRDNAELVIGVRERTQRERRAPGTRVALRLIGLLYRHQFEDLGPFRAIRFPALIALGMTDGSAAWNVEMQVKAVKLGLHIAEVPVTGGQAPNSSRLNLRAAKRSLGGTGRVLFQIFRHATVR